MPYINEEMQNRSQDGPEMRDYGIAHRVNDVIAFIKEEFDPSEREGVCNYVVTRIIAGAMRPETGWRYAWLSRAHEVFLAAAAEFYRRLLGPYEDKCIKKNGDIPEYACEDF